ncbi:MAG: ATP-dependent exonuclease SbcCD, C subunit-like protein [Spirochaetes bacterium]|nr:ATP-dependent exonuclease SbcCD, C subunit-like protein [Spirochaetota bacterium]
MTIQAELEFINDDTLAGFRLTRIDVYNWGTFHDKVWTLFAGSRNVLVTGDIGSGKSTLVDAITTLLVPANRISYNKAAGAETRERTLRSYVQGYYKSERSEAGYSARPVALRDQKNYSVILGVFSNEGYGQTITLAQVFRQRELSGQPERFFVIANAELKITSDFTDFGNDIKDLKKKLKARPDIEDVYDTFPPYAASFKRRFGIKNDQALELFLQTVSMKTVGNLTDFVRAHMLEAFDTEARIRDLIDHFENLSRAHEAVLKAKNQIGKLGPVIKDMDRRQEVTETRDDLRMCRDGLKLYFAHLKKTLLEKRIQTLDNEHEKIETKIRRLDERMSGQQAERDTLRQSIAENGGDRLERLNSEINSFLEKKRHRMERYEDYRSLADRAAIPFDGSMESFLNNRDIISLEQASADAGEIELQNRRTEAEVEHKRLRNDQLEFIEEIESLKKRKSNISSAQIRIRADLCRSLGIEEDELPFAGELIRVSPEESRWEGAAERLLRNFGLSMLVPEGHYNAVSEWVDITNCRGRIIYYKVPEKWKDNPADIFRDDSLAHKLSVKQDSLFFPWVRSELAKRFDFSCCEDIRQFRREKQAITISGQIKGAGNRHDKDDRYDINDRSRYILGWSNKSKITLLESRLSKLEKDIAGTEKAIDAIRGEQEKTSGRKVLLARMNAFKAWEEMDWEPVAVQINDLEREKKELESASDILKILTEKLHQLESDLKNTRVGLDEEKDLRSKNRQKHIYTEELLNQCREIITASDISNYDDLAEKLDAYRKKSLGYRQLSVESADNRQQEMREWIQAKIDSEDKKLKTLDERIIKNMQDYKRDYPAETTDVDAGIESGNEFREMLRQLELDDLPRFETRFKELLNENTIREIAKFQSQLNRERQVIRERIEIINNSLADIEYNKGRYIKIEAQESPDIDIRDFRQSLRACTEGALTGSDDDQYAEGKFLQVRAIIDRFQGREGFSDPDRRWTRKVTDVRNWFAFAASERWQEDDSEYEHYTDSGGKSGGQKEKLAYTILAASLAYQFGLEWGEVKSRSFRFVVIDEAFGRGSDESTRFALELFKRLNMQLLIVTPLQKIHIIEPYVSNVGFIDCPGGNESRIRNLTIEEYHAAKEAVIA